MSGVPWQWGVVIALAGVAGGGVKALIDYVRNTRKDSAEVTLQAWVQSSKDQGEMRAAMQREIGQLRTDLRELDERYHEQAARIQQLTIENLQLKADKERLEERVAELETELRGYELRLQRATEETAGGL